MLSASKGVAGGFLEVDVCGSLLRGLTACAAAEEVAAVFAEATTVVPLIGSDAYHRGAWKNRDKRRWNKLFGK